MNVALAGTSGLQLDSVPAPLSPGLFFFLLEEMLNLRDRQEERTSKLETPGAVC